MISFRAPGWVLVLPGLLALLPAMARAQESVPNHAHQPSGAFLTRWLLCGPFSSPAKTAGVPDRPARHGLEVDFLAATGGERAVRPQPGQTVTHEAGTVSWKLHEAAGEVINLDAAVSTRSEVVAYAYGTVECDADQNAILAVGSNDGVRLWINGEGIWKHLSGRTLLKDEDRIPVRLKAGRNEVLLKI